MNISFIDLILCFSVYSFLGWILETSFKTMRDRQFVNSGFLFGPFVPIYGFGAIIVLHWLLVIDPLFLLADPLLGLIIRAVSIIVLASLLEYFTGVLLETMFKRQWWDYSHERFHIKGRISLKYSTLWGILGYSILQAANPVIFQVLGTTPIHLRYFLAASIVVFLAFDLIQRVIFLWHLHMYFSARYLQLRRDYFNKWVHRQIYKLTLNRLDSYSGGLAYTACVDDLIFHPLIQSMQQFRHHKNTSCLDHSLNVSYTSYKLCKALGWDYRSAARGGLLHDLFLYDWRTTTLNEGRHGFIHPKIALENASVISDINDLEKDIILKHMFPLTWQPPTFKESLLVCLIDKHCALQEGLGFSVSSRHILCQELLQNEPC